MSAVERELQKRLSQLKPHEKRQVLEYTRTLGLKRPRGTPGAELLSLAGTITEEDARQMAQAIEEGCEQIHPDGW